MYFERDYIRGMATDKLPEWKYRDAAYARRLAELLGRAAAASIVVGRALERGREPGPRSSDAPAQLDAVFDDGDEVIIEDEHGQPKELLVGDHSSTFADFTSPLIAFARAYAQPVNRRASLVPDPAAFADAYLQAFERQLRDVQQDYRKRQQAFDGLFSGSKFDPNGSFAWRWQHALRRLRETDVDALVRAIRQHIVTPPETRPAEAATPVRAAAQHGRLDTTGHRQPNSSLLTPADHQ